MKKRILILILALSMIFVTACSGGTNEPSAEEPVQQSEQPEGQATYPELKLKLGHQTDENDPYHQYSLKFKKIVEEKTDGNVTIEIYPNAQLGYDRDLVEALQFGNIDLAFVTTSPISNFAAQFGVLDLPYVFDGWDDAEKFVQSDLAEKLMKEAEGSGILGLALMPRGARNLTNSKLPVYTPDDIKGLKLRVIESPAFIKTFEDLETNVTGMSWGEVFTALQQGTIDGQENPPTVIKTYNLVEVQKYLSLTEHIFSFAALMGSNPTLGNQPQNVQDVLYESALEAALEQAKEERTNEALIIEELAELGFEVNEVEKDLFKEKINSPYVWFTETYGDDYLTPIMSKEY